MVDEREDDRFDREIHGRMVDGDPLAAHDLVEHYLPRLTRHLASRYRTTDDDLIHDAATEALFDYCEHPVHFDPARRSLRGYLRMAAERDLLNLRERHRSRFESEEVVDHVEMERKTRNRALRVDDFAEQLVSDDAAASLLQESMAAVWTGEERIVLRLMIGGEKSTAAFARALGWDGLPLKEQRERVYAIKDRLRKRIRRQRGNYHG